MNYSKSFLAVMAMTAISLGAAADDVNYKLVWNDEFNGSALDTRAWNIEVNGDGGGNNELQYYRSENVSLGTDSATGAHCLILTAKKESYSGKSFTSGRVNTSAKAAFKHGKIESRIKFPKTANGLWPAFWMLGSDYGTVGWPRCGEIDIVEMGNSQGIKYGTQDRFFNGACHWGFYNDQGQYPNYARSTTNSYSLQDGEFHTFTLEWDDDYLSMYLDKDKYPNEEPYYKMGVSDYSGDWATGNYFHHEFFVVYDLAIGGNFTGIWSTGGITALADGEAQMLVDWVRVYQDENDLSATATIPEGYSAGVTTVAVDENNAQQPTIIYDALGKIVNEMSHGMYIVKTGNVVKKIFKR